MLRSRDRLLRLLRDFFIQRGFIEVETPVVADEVIPELHIEPFRLADGRFLQASPELYMKRLLADGAAAIFQVTRSFRRGERGRLHRPEFTLVEWYRRGDDMQTGMELLDELAQSLLDTPPATRISYDEAFQRHVGLCPHTAPTDELATAVAVAELAIPTGMDRFNRDEWLNLMLATRVEQHLGLEQPEILYHYPASQASLAKLATDAAGHQVAERFELYWRGIELANGYHELTDAVELRGRFEAVNNARVADGRDALPMPEQWLADIAGRLPASTGVALGFDRLVMLVTGAESIDDVIPH